MNISDIITMHRYSSPDKTAIVSGDRSLTFKRLAERINRLANALLGIGVTPGERVALVLGNQIEFWEAHMALSKIGAVSIFINPRLKTPEIEYIARDSESSAAIVDCRALPQAAPALTGLIPLQRQIAAGSSFAGLTEYEELLRNSSAAEPPRIESTDSTGLIYTAGTTGKPKGAVRKVTAGTLEMLQNIIREFGFSASDSHLVASPLTHSAPLGFAIVAQVTGAPLALMSKFDAKKAFELIERHKITTTCMVPTHLEAMLAVSEEERKRFDLSSLRVVVCGAARLHADTKRRFLDAFGDVLFEYYGSTEGGINLLMKPAEMRSHLEQTGRPFADVEVKILDENGQELPPNVPGQLYISCSGLMEGYYRRDEDTRAVFRDGFLSVGDVAVRDAEGYFTIVDRKIDMIVSGGVNVYPAEVETVLLSHPAIADAAVIGIPDAYWGEAVHAVVALRKESNVSEREILDFCSSKLADFKRPKLVHFMSEIPRNPHGKILKTGLREQYGAALRANGRSD